MRLVFALFMLGMTAESVLGCGLDWTLPQAHFDGVDERGFVSYWEQIGEADLGDDLVIPLNINFNSRRESSSPTLGKGWIVALLESHVEPIDENSIRVIMPDGWIFNFLRNGNSETWRGNARWLGETNGSVFTITAPCGWRIKFDGGKIQEIDTNKNRTLLYKYNAGNADEVDEGARIIAKVEGRTASSCPNAIRIGDTKVVISMVRRPQIISRSNQNVVIGFDESLGFLQWPNGKNETLTYDPDEKINPTITVAPVDWSSRKITWDATTRQIKTDDSWKYLISAEGKPPRIERVDGEGEKEVWLDNPEQGLELVQHAGQEPQITHTFTSGPLRGRVRTVGTAPSKDTQEKELYRVVYDESGRVVREIRGVQQIYHDKFGNLTKIIEGNDTVYNLLFDNLGRRSLLINKTRHLEVHYLYDDKGRRDIISIDGKLLYEREIINNKASKINQLEQIEL